MLIDTHAHLDFEEFNADREVVIERARKNGVEFIINIGTNKKLSEASLFLAKKYPFIFATVSLHPLDVGEEKFDEIFFQNLAKEAKIVAIGETGLDYYHQTNKEKQQEIFRKLIRIAHQVNKPLILHCREAEEDLLKILSEENLPTKRGVIHCFGKDYSVAKKFLDLGFYISYTGNITYNPNRAISLKNVPLERIMIETDCPFMAPQPVRGKRNEPAYLFYIAQKVAEIKGVSFEKVAEITSKNALNLFNLK